MHAVRGEFDDFAQFPETKVINIGTKTLVDQVEVDILAVLLELAVKEATTKEDRISRKTS